MMKIRSRLCGAPTAQAGISIGWTEYPAPSRSLQIRSMVKVSDCLYKLRGGTGANALHPNWKGIDLPAEMLKDYAVRAWFSGHLFPEKPNGNRLDLAALEAKGITDVFLNEPEVYL